MNKKLSLTIFKLLLLVLGMKSLAVFALSYPFPETGTNVVGKVQSTQAEPGDNFSTIGRRFDVGYFELIEANAKVSPKDPPAWNPLVVPTRFILPPTPYKGVVINLAELRLYYFEPEKKQVVTLPVGVGRQGWDTPIGLTSITNKTRLPTWHVPESIRVERAKEGVQLPKSVPPGADNPLGDYALRLAVPNGSYLVHGTNDPSGVGRRSSSGCIRMLPEDIEELFTLVQVGTPVLIINEPVKVGWNGVNLYLEAHVPLEGEKTHLAAVKQRIEEVASQHKAVVVDWDKVHKVVDAQTGIPTIISMNSTVDVPVEKGVSSKLIHSATHQVSVVEAGTPAL